MTWFLIALIAPALWSVTNHLDKYLISKYFKGAGTGALIIFSALVGLLVMPAVYAFRPDVIAIPLPQALAIIGGGMVYVVSILIYLYALQKDETSIVVPLFQTVPVFAFVLGYLFLGETLTQRQLVGSALVVIGGILLSLDLSVKRPTLKSAIFFLMLLASFLVAASGLVFKMVASETSFWTAAFWGYVGDVLMGVFFLAAVSPYREEFLRVWRLNDPGIIALNGLNELITVGGNLAFRFATLLAPLALVSAVNGFQPLFVFLYGVVITLAFPRLGTESLMRKHLVQKALTIGIMVIGTYVLNG